MKKVLILYFLSLLFLNNCTNKNSYIIENSNLNNKKLNIDKRLYIVKFNKDKYGFTSTLYNRFLDSMMFNSKPFINKIYFKKIDDKNSEDFPKLSGTIKKLYIKKIEYNMVDQQKENFKIYKKCNLYQFWLNVDYTLYFPTYNDTKNIKTYRQYDTCFNGNIDENLVIDAMINDNIDNYLSYIKEKLK